MMSQGAETDEDVKGSRHDVPSISDSLGRPSAEILVLVGQRTAIIMDPTDFAYKWDLHRADGICVMSRERERGGGGQVH